MDDIVFHVDDSDAEAFFDYAGYKARNLTVPLQSVKRIILDAVTEAFLTEGESTGHAWQELSPSRVAERGGLDHPILRWTDDLFAEATSEHSVKVRRNNLFAAELHYEVGLDYAAAQQAGGWFTSDGAQHPPARPFVVFTTIMDLRVHHVFVDWLNDLKDRNRRRADRPLALPFIPGLEEF